mgnify:CR=1 FL=1|tara:strand:- start:16 stop:198 length:183 start_codon:yes stop_codon:yes gene_type:complete
MNKGQWTIEKVWDFINDNGKEVEEWTYVVGYVVEDDIINEDHFKTREEAEEYLAKMKGEL